jgi:methionine synthase II (cobalamin-independent)
MSSDLACLATGIGSLPHTSPKEACDLIVANLKDIPFWPQLSNLSFKENMYAQFLYHLPGVVIDENEKRVYIDDNVDSAAIDEFLARLLSENVGHFAYSEEYFHGLFEMLKRQDDFGGITMFKGQITGPISLGFQVTDENRKPIFYNDIYRDMIIKSLGMMARWQEQTLGQICDKTLLFVDEPFLSMIGSAFISITKEKAVAYMNEVLGAMKGRKAIHCCANTDWGLVAECAIDVLSFDAYEYADTLFLYSDDVIRFIERGGMIAWGIVPNNEKLLATESVERLVSRLEGIMKRLSDRGISMDEILSSSLFTPSCGLGPTTVSCAEEALPILVKVSDKMREKHGFA